MTPEDREVQVKYLLASCVKVVAKYAGRGSDPTSIRDFMVTPRATAIARAFWSDLESAWVQYLDAIGAPVAMATPGAVSPTVSNIKPYQFPTLDETSAIGRPPINQPAQPAVAHRSPPRPTPKPMPIVSAGKAAPTEPPAVRAIAEQSSEAAKPVEVVARTPAPAPAAKPSSSPEPSPVLPTKPVDPTPIRFAIPNGRVGTTYQETPVPNVDAPGRVLVTAVTLPPDLGLTYSEAQNSIQGTPVQPGEFQFLVTYRFLDDPPTTAARTAKVTLVITPDPRSLWLNLPSDRSAPFWKEDSDTKILIGPHRRVVAASQRGRSHAHKGLCRDDDFYIDDVAGWSIAVVADGAGSAKYSRRGAQIAVREAGTFLTQLVAGDKGTEILAAANKRGAGAGSDVQDGLKTAIYESVGYAAFQALRAMTKEVETRAAGGMSIDLRDLDTTLLIALTHPTDAGVLVGTYWIGDGAVGIYDRTAGIRLCGKPDGGEFSGGTRFLAPAYVNQTELWNRTQAHVVPHMDALILMTDGVSDPKFPSEAALGRSENWNALWDELTSGAGFPDQTDGVEQSLLKWLDFWVTGEHDDRTIALVW